MGDPLQLCPMTQREARAFVARHHRHHDPPRGDVFRVGLSRGDVVVGVAIVGRPVSRRLQDGWTLEVTRVCTDGTKNACSKLYGACWRAARALGWRRLITYTLPEEGGGQPPRCRLAPHRRGGRRLVVEGRSPSRRHTPDAAQAPLGDER